MLNYECKTFYPSNLFNGTQKNTCPKVKIQYIQKSNRREVIQDRSLLVTFIVIPNFGKLVKILHLERRNLCSQVGNFTISDRRILTCHQNICVSKEVLMYQKEGAIFEGTRCKWMGIVIPG